MTKNERLTLGLQGKLYRLTCIKLENITGFAFKTVNERTTKQLWSKEQVKRMIRMLCRTVNPNNYRFETTPYDEDFWTSGK